MFSFIVIFLNHNYFLLFFIWHTYSKTIFFTMRQIFNDKFLEWKCYVNASVWIWSL